jgi:hypothetical protein
MPGPSDDVPRWQPPSQSSDDVPRWVPPAPARDVPVWEPQTPARTDAVPRWQPEAETPTWEPEVEVPRWQPPATPRAAEVETESPRRAPGTKPVSPFVRPFAWWGRHPWLVVWVAVGLVPVAVVVLRVVDEWGFERLVSPLQWLFLGLFALVLVRGALFSAGRSRARLAVGLAGALAATAALLWPVTQVTFGRVICPERAGADLGIPAAAAAVQAWQRGDPAATAWRGGEPAPAWVEKSRAITLLDYQMVDTGCFERVAPIDATQTWHDFRVTIKEGERAPLSKVVVIRTAAESGGWKITGIEGPLP